MVRIEFVKGVGGVVNLINGNLLSIDREEITNIQVIDRVVVDSYDSFAVNYSLFALEITGYVIIFDSLENLNIYLQQIDMFDGEIMNPGLNGLKKPSWDVASCDKREGIQEHTYVDTNIEQDLINN